MTSTAHRPLKAGEIIACFGLIALGLFLRAPDALLNPQFIAEDGPVFFVGQFSQLLPPLFGPVQGYWVFLGRLVAWVASAFPVVLAPLVYNLSAILLEAASLAYFCFRARDLFHPLASFAVVLLVPMVSSMMLNNVTHLQWFTQFVLVSASLLPTPLAPSKSRMLRAVEMIALVVAAFTGPFAIFCLFVYLFLRIMHASAAVARLTRIRDSLKDYLDSLDNGALFVTAFAGVILLFLASGQNKVPLRYFPDMLANLYFLVAGVGLQIHALGPVLIPPSLFAGFQGILVAMVLLVPANASVRLGCLVLLLYGWLCLLAGFEKSQSLGFSVPAFNYGDSYFLALAIFEWLVLWRIASRLLFDREIIATCLVVSALGSAAIAHPYWHIRPALPDMRWSEYAGKIEAGEAVDIPINPPPWRLQLPGKKKQ